MKVNLNRKTYFLISDSCSYHCSSEIWASQRYLKKSTEKTETASFKTNELFNAENSDKIVILKLSLTCNLVSNDRQTAITYDPDFGSFKVPVRHVQLIKIFAP